MPKSALLISLDFELYWGVCDLYSVEEWRPQIAQVRTALARILDLFDRYQVHATWATVGFLFFRNRLR